MKKIFLIIASVWLTGCVTTQTVSYKALNPLPGETPKQIDLIVNVYHLKTSAPTVIYMHGCSGLDGAYIDWRNKLNDWGYNVVQPDSLRTRNANTACKRGKVSHNDRIEDLMATAEWVNQQPWHTGKIGVIGFSMGGQAALNSSSDGGDLYQIKPNTYKNKNISVSIAYYPSCLPQHKNASIPTLILIGDADNATPPVWCKFIAEEGKNISLKIYPGVHHSFDTPGFNHVSRFGWTVKYDAPAAADAEKRTREFLKKHISN